MRSLSASELLNIWEWGRNQPSWSRAIKLLATACPETSIDMLTQLSLGQRDAMLLTLREWTFGSQLVSQVTCPSCGEVLELNFDVADMRVASLSLEPIEKYCLEIADCEVSFRLPNSLDMIAITEHKQPEISQEILLERCILEAVRGGEYLPFQQLPSHVSNAIIAQMAQVDPQANVPIDISCSLCNHQWQSLFDIVAFFWAEINTWGFRVLREVHTLAAAYGWREADVLAMSPRRRQLYLKMVTD
ncbi:phage baseplate protein [Nostoc sp. FACHB-892]|uniref:T4 family baseplate hub assembly chaperone n=1 Tax=Nostoc sp. FACHB-892 TaxID=2692843 RepID=UPI0016832815|nr:phage baseplate protein [Nostoc sp. FACHB-892]MBD2729689.1 phage baseplate protein [Nostoc sp. FACHB-892]